MAPSSSSSPSKSPLSLHQSFHFTPIPECEEDDLQELRFKNRATPSCDGGSSATPSHHHTPTPLHHNQNGKPNYIKRCENVFSDDDDGGAVSCNNCRPHHPHREKISFLPLENHNPSFISSPNVIIKSIFQSLTRKSPKRATAKYQTSLLPPSSSDATREEEWHLAVAELSNKLIQATKNKEEAVLEASKLKSSMAELEKKLTKLEIYCHNLKSDLDECNKQKQSIRIRIRQQDGFNDRIIKQFLVSVSESRSSIRALSRSLVSQLQTVGGKIYDRLTHLLQPFDVKINSFAKNPKNIIFYLEALLSRVFFEDFEVSGFQKSGSTRILNPIDRCESNYALFNVLVGLTWDEVLSKGTKHFSEEFSQFCDRKLSDVVSMLSWNGAWPEPLLKAFFWASKSVWLVRLLANSVNPGMQIFRVEKGVQFNPVYMNETGGDRLNGLIQDSVRIMVQPGFHVYGSVVKCKVVCNNRTNDCDNDNKGQSRESFRG